MDRFSKRGSISVETDNETYGKCYEQKKTRCGELLVDQRKLRYGDQEALQGNDDSDLYENENQKEENFRKREHQMQRF